MKALPRRIKRAKTREEGALAVMVLQWVVQWCQGDARATATSPWWGNRCTAEETTYFYGGYELSWYRKAP